MSDDPLMAECFLCGAKFRFGQHQYDGRRIPQWDLMVCNLCYDSNRDGIVPETYPHLVEYLNSRGIPISLNEKSWISWPR